MDELRDLAAALSSNDFVESREARWLLAERMSPDRLMALWRDSADLSAAALLRDAAAAENSDVYALIGAALLRVLESSDAVEFACLDVRTAHCAAAQFLIDAIAHEDLSLAAAARPAVTALFCALYDSRDEARAVGALLCAAQERKERRSEWLLRLLDTDTPESAANGAVVQFLAAHTPLLLTTATAAAEHAVRCDPLLAANYLFFCAVVARHAPVPAPLRSAIQSAIDIDRDNDNDGNNNNEDGGSDGSSDGLHCAAWHAAAMALRAHDGNAAQYAAEWALPALALWARPYRESKEYNKEYSKESRENKESRDAAAAAVAAAVTTASGWAVVAPQLSQSSAEFARALAAPALSALSLLQALLASPHVSDAALSAEVLRAAWRHSAHPDDAVRAALWAAVADGIGRAGVAAVFAAPCAAAIAAESAREPLVEVREAQLRIAERLSVAGVLPEPVAARLAECRKRGLYPPGSAGVEAMERR